MDLAIYDAPDQIEAIWRRLEAVARPPYALSWGSIENWLSSLHDTDRPALNVILDDAGEPIAAAFDDQPMLRSPVFPALGMATTDFHVIVGREVPTLHVDLDTVRAVEGGYIATRPAVLRAALSHARLQAGELAVESATAAPRAHAIMNELIDLAGTADNPKLRRLIDRRSPHGEIQLLRVRSGEATLGCFYNVLWNEHVAYQLAGFASPADADLCHTAAIEYSAASGLAFYDLQPEDARLATGETRNVVLYLHRRATSARLAG
jgi:hypothetical protein